MCGVLVLSGEIASLLVPPTEPELVFASSRAETLRHSSICLFIAELSKGNSRPHTGHSITPLLTALSVSSRQCIESHSLDVWWAWSLDVCWGPSVIGVKKCVSFVVSFVSVFCNIEILTPTGSQLYTVLILRL